MPVDTHSTAPLPLDQFHVRVWFNSADAAQDFLLTQSLDFGCRAAVRHEGDALFIPAICTSLEIAGLEMDGFRLTIGENLTAARRARLSEIGEGDRFEEGRITPHGLGIKTSSEDTPRRE